MTVTRRLRLAAGATLQRDADGRTELRAGRLGLDLGALPEGLAVALESLIGEGVNEESLFGRVRDGDGAAALLALHAHLADLETAGLLQTVLLDDGIPLATRTPVARFSTTAATAEPAPPGEGRDAHRLSRFATLRRDEGDLILESPLAAASIRFHTPAALARLATLTGTEEAPPATAHVGLSPEATAVLRDWLLADGLLEPRDHDPITTLWEPHDLAFHQRSRGGIPGAAYGGTFPFVGEITPEPALRPPHDGPRIELPRPDMERLCREDPPFSAVIEGRRSLREPGPEAVTAEQLGELLHRAARVRGVAELPTHEVSDRPYPGGGALYELEIYVAAGRCSGVARGLYHYEPAAHTLVDLGGSEYALGQLLDRAGTTAGTVPPDVLLVIAARFPRVMWKYRSMAYAGILKNVGVLFQNLYLVATAMGLGACALGGGDARTFAEASGLDPLVEGSVGEMIVNRPPETPTSGA